MRIEKRDSLWDIDIHHYDSWMSVPAKIRMFEWWKRWLDMISHKILGYPVLQSHFNAVWNSDGVRRLHQDQIARTSAGQPSSPRKQQVLQLEIKITFEGCELHPFLWTIQLDCQTNLLESRSAIVADLHGPGQQLSIRQPADSGGWSAHAQSVKSELPRLAKSLTLKCNICPAKFEHLNITASFSRTEFSCKTMFLPGNTGYIWSPM